MGKDDFILILALGKKPSFELEVQKRAIILSKILGIELDFVPYKFGYYSEQITEKLNDERLGYLISRNDKKYKLTEMGQKAYDHLLEQLKAKNKEDVAQFLESLSKLNEDDLLALTYHLFPESMIESEIKERVKKRIETLKKESPFESRIEKDRIVIEINS